MEKMTLKALRVNVGLVQKEAAKQIGVSNKTLLNWEKGNTYPNQKQIEKICEVYKTSYDCINFTG
jgi:DNA-binding XRE family transcriptional regulator